ncbi:ABC transporter permease [Luteimonas marina]|uniref:Transport permease protein n=1 Tax=Luteimonas marina TaxID=488485 RepID=A0A5C5TY21_9GAMM|nr:ABC transporter permease [Luteimonas marina]TWT18636.1 ABC transporter permease [Luteimonas marina]
MTSRSIPAIPGYVSLWRMLVMQELVVRYRGTLLGRIWPVLMPLLMLAVYGFVFGAVFRARWPGLAEDDHLGFTINLFAGLLVHGMLAESVGQAAGLMQRNANFVRKMVFPLPVLVAVPIGTAVFHAVLGFAVLVAVNALSGRGIHLAVLALPVVLLPYLILLYGLALVVAALSVYLRDLNQFVGVLIMVTLFTGTVFFPRDMVPEALAGVVRYNPISWPTEAVRDCVLRGVWPDPLALGTYALVACGILAAGWMAFSLLRRGFADLL